MSDDLDFKKRADAALSLLGRDLASAAEDYGFQCGKSAGTISVDCGTPSGKIVITPNPQAHHITVQVAGRTYKLDWDIVQAGFVHAESGQTLREIVEQALSKQLRQEVTL
jgi:frataxin-like iron-binding protein CyaY